MYCITYTLIHRGLILVLYDLSSAEGGVKKVWKCTYYVIIIWMFPYQFSLAPAYSIINLWAPHQMISRIYNSEFWIHTYQVFLPVYKADDSGIIADILRETNLKLEEFLSEFHLEKIRALDTDACIYSNVSYKIFLRACLFCWDPDCCKSRFHPGNCFYSNLETKTLLQQSRDRNLTAIWSLFIVFYNFSTL